MLAGHRGFNRPRKAAVANQQTELDVAVFGIVGEVCACQQHDFVVDDDELGVAVRSPNNERTGVTPDHIAKSGIYDQPKPAGYEEALLAIVERGRDQAGRIGRQ